MKVVNILWWERKGSKVIESPDLNRNRSLYLLRQRNFSAKIYFSIRENVFNKIYDEYLSSYSPETRFSYLHSLSNNETRKLGLFKIGPGEKVFSSK